MKITKSQLKQIIKEELARVLSEEEQEIDLTGIINNALKAAELPLSAENIQAFYHAKPSDRVFLVPTDAQHAAMSPEYRPKPSRVRRGEWDFPEKSPLMPNIDADKVGVDINTLVDTLKKSGLSSWSKEQYVGPPYSNVPIPSGWEYNPEWGWVREEEEEWEVEFP